MKTRTRRGTVTIAFVTVAALTIPLIALAQTPAILDAEDLVLVASTDEVDIYQDGDWTRWQFMRDLPSPEIRVLRGTRSSQGCEYQFEETVPSLDTGLVRIEREIAHNMRTCVSVAEAAVVAETWEKTAEGESSVVSESFDIEPALTTAASGWKTVWLKVRYYDPAFITVNQVESRVTFFYTGSCVTNSKDHKGFWLKFAGWQLVSKDGQAARNCSYAATESEGLFKHPNFCSIPTFAEYYYVTVKGHANGSQSNSYHTTKWGGCAALLSRSSSSS